MERLFRTTMVAALATGLLALGAIATLGDDLDLLGEGGRVPPYIPVHSYYDSGWFTVSPGDSTIKVHDLEGNPDYYLVFFFGKNSCGIHNVNYGTAEQNHDWYGSEWFRLDKYILTVYRCEQDPDAGTCKAWDEIRVLIIRVL